MKKSFILVAILTIVSVGMAVAQPRAIGLNLGSGAGISYQHSLGEANILDVAASIPVLVDGFGVGGNVTYDWINPFGKAIPWDYEGTWNWYLGVGAAGGMYGLFSSEAANIWYAGVAGHAGIEYQFWFPLQLSLDYRPTIGVAGNNGIGFDLNGLFNGISLGVRYSF